MSIGTGYNMLPMRLHFKCNQSQNVKTEHLKDVEERRLADRISSITAVVICQMANCT